MNVPEVIAYLDVLENRLENMKKEVRGIRYALFDTLDTSDDSVLD